MSASNIYTFKKEEEETVIRKRLLYDGRGMGHDKRLATICQLITKISYSQNYDEQEAQKALENLDKALKAADKHERAFEMYDKTYTQLDNAIALKREELKALKIGLDKLKLELDFVEKLREVEKYPDSISSEAKMQEYDAKRKHLLQTIEKQRQSMSILMEACQKLQLVLDGPPEVVMVE